MTRATSTSTTTFNLFSTPWYTGSDRLPSTSLGARNGLSMRGDFADRQTTRTLNFCMFLASAVMMCPA